jgi:hypothetical protein
MSADRELTRIVRSWLQTDEHESADRVLDVVFDRLATTPQRRPVWQAWRNPLVTRSTKFALAGAAVLVLAVLGIRMYFGQSSGPGVAGPTPSSTPTATPMASQTAAASQQPSPTASPPQSSDVLAPGRYAIIPEPFSLASPRVMVTVPAGYQAIGTGAYAWAIVKVGDEPTEFSGLGVWIVDAVYEDACRWAATDVDNQSLGPTVDDFVTALRETGRVGQFFIDDVTVDGYSGKRFETSVNYDVDAFAMFGGFTECDEGEYRSWPGRFHQAPLQIDDIRVLDVDGTRLIIATTYFDTPDYATTSAQDLAELEDMFQSIDIQVP